MIFMQTFIIMYSEVFEHLLVCESVNLIKPIIPYKLLTLQNQPSEINNTTEL